MTKLAILFLGLAFGSQGQTLDHPTEPTKHPPSVQDWTLLVGSVGVGLDVASSWGKLEGTAIYRSPDGTCGARGVALRIGIWGVSVAVQKRLCKPKHKGRRLCKVMQVMNVAVGARGSIQAARNWRY
jgi:hypothetical protein